MIVASALLGAACDDAPKPPSADPDRAPSTTASSETSGADEGEATATPAGDSSGSAADPAAAEDGPPAAGANAAADPAAAGGDDKPVLGAAQNNDAYGTWLQSSGRYVAGKPARVQAVVVAKGDFKCNEKYPFKFKLDAPPAGVSYPETTVRGISYGKKRSTLTIAFTAAKAGKTTISGTFYVSVCDPSKCKIGKEKLSVTVDVDPS